MCTCKLMLVFVIVQGTLTSAKKYDSKTSGPILGKVVKQCLEADSRFTCFSEKAAIVIERSMNWDIPLFEGVQLHRNEVKINNRYSKSLTGFPRLTNSIFNFIDTHTFTIDLDDNGYEQSSRKDDGGSGGEGESGGFGGGGGLFNLDKSQLRKEKKYYQYAFMVLLGIFGLTGPLVMKVLGIMAAKALLAAKAALIIVGSVALKKIFDNGNEKSPKIKVHTVPSHDSDEHEYDRVGHHQMPFVYSNSLNSIDNHPYSAYYNDDFATVLYGTPYNPNKSSKAR